jgi:hypothetical protein
VPTFSQGNLLLKARKPQEALKHFEEYLTLDPKGRSCRFHKGVGAKAKAGDRPESEKQLKSGACRSSFVGVRKVRWMSNNLIK